MPVCDDAKPNRQRKTTARPRRFSPSARGEKSHRRTYSYVSGWQDVLLSWHLVTQDFLDLKISDSQPSTNMTEKFNLFLAETKSRVDDFRDDLISKAFRCEIDYLD